MSDFANYLRVAIQGLSSNTPLSRASAYEKVRKVIRRQLEARSADQAEVNKTIEDLENAILDMEAEQLMLGEQPDASIKVPAPDHVQLDDGESNVTPISRKGSEAAAPASDVTGSVVADVPAVGNGASGAGGKSAASNANVALRESNIVSGFADKPVEVPAATSAPQYAPPRATVMAGASGQAVKVETSQTDPLEDFQSALSAELALPAKPKERPAPQASAQPESDAAQPEPVAAPMPAGKPAAAKPAVSTQPEEEPTDLGFDVKILLRQAIENEDMRDPATREIIYRRARTALVKHLKGQSPQPDFDTVHAHIERLNAAIREVEAEQTAASVDVASMDTTANANDFMSELEDIWSEELEDVQFEEVQLAGKPKAVVPKVATIKERDLERSIADEVDEAVQDLTSNDSGDAAFLATLEADLPDDRSIDDEVDEAVQQLIAEDVTRSQPAKTAKPRAQKPVQKQPDHVIDLEEELLSLEFEDEGRSPERESANDDHWRSDDMFELPEDVFDDDFAPSEPPARSATRHAYRADDRPRQRRRGGGRIFAVLVVLLIIAAVAAGAFMFPQLSSNYIAKIRSIGGEAVDVASDLIGKPADEKSDSATAAIADMPAQNESDGATAAKTDRSEAGGVNEPANAGPAGEVETAAVGEDAAAKSALPQVLGEKAFLFSTLGGQQPVVSGNVEWSMIESSPQPGMPAEPAIRAEVTIPAEKLRARLTLRRNLDATLPATHLLELVFIPGDSGTGGDIATVEDVSFVQSAEQRRQPLIGSIVKIADNIFIFALADIPAARQLHDDLLSNPDLIEIRYATSGGRRATLRLVSGVTGGKVFAAATAAWGNDGGNERAAPAPMAAAPAEQPPAPPQPATEPAQTTAQNGTPELKSGRPVIPDTVPVPLDRP